jgi:ribosome biogenesis GTPase / thiamine phosphate phosphatase
MPVFLLGARPRSVNPGAGAKLLRQQEGAQVFLKELGWDSYFEALWQKQQGSGWVPARVVSQQRGLWRIVGDFGECWSAPSGKMRAAAEADGDWPTVGDWVSAEVFTGEQPAIIHAVLPRRSQFVRKVAGKRVEQQVIAANVDIAFLVAALDGDFNVRRQERYLAQCWESGAWPVVVLNKADDCNDVDARAAEVGCIAREAPVFVLSARTGQGIDALGSFLVPGQTVVLLGSSGVGKSTLVNRLSGRDLQAVQPTREKDSRGRHTTSARELFLLPCGALVIDTPGLRELQLWDATDGVAETFADIDELAAKCRFRDCRHENEPGCAVQAALRAGSLDEARLENRRKLEREQEFLRRKMDPEARSEAQHKIKVLMRGVRQKYRQREDEGKP